MALRPFACLIALTLAASPLRGQEPQVWIRSYFAAEPDGPKFGHAWLDRAARVRQAREAYRRTHGMAAPPGQYALRGEFRLIVLAGTFSDIEPSYSPERYLEAFFADVGRDGVYTLRQYFTEVSGSLFTFDGTVTPWMRVDSTKDYYLDDFSNFGRGRYEEYMYEVLVRADSFVAWREYDNDGPDGVPDSGDDDGYVDMVAFLYPLFPGGCSLQPDLSGFIPTGFQLSRVSRVFGQKPFTTSAVGANGASLLVDDFILSAGLDCFSGGMIATMNVNVHEMGHALGLPDLYDRDGSSAGVGMWDVMGHGLWAAAGKPAHFGAWSRRQLGWGELVLPERDTALRLEPVELTRVAIEIPIPRTREYFLLENRQPILADSGLPGGGMLMWHIDDAVLERTLPAFRGADDEFHPGVRVVQADGRWDMFDLANKGDDGDPFPGSTGMRFVTDVSEPSTRGYGAVFSGIRLLNISERDRVITLDVLVGKRVASVEIVPDAAVLVPGEVLPLRAVLRDDAGVELTDPPVTWSLSNEGAASLTEGPALEAVAVGALTVRAMSEGLADSINVAVASPEHALRAAAGGGVLNSVARAVFDRVGNDNGRFDIGDVVLFLQRVATAQMAGRAP